MKRYGFIDPKGQVSAAEKFDEGGYSSEALAAVGIDHKLGYIDKTGRVVIQAQFSQADAFTGGLGRVMLTDGKLAYTDKSGRFVWGEQ